MVCTPKLFYTYTWIKNSQLEASIPQTKEPMWTIISTKATIMKLSLLQLHMSIFSCNVIIKHHSPTLLWFISMVFADSCFFLCCMHCLLIAFKNLCFTPSLYYTQTFNWCNKTHKPLTDNFIRPSFTSGKGVLMFVNYWKFWD